MKKLIIALTFYLALAGCTGLMMERSKVTDPANIEGSYNLVMIGGTYAADAERLAILDVENDGSSFRPVTIPGRINVVHGLTATEALHMAETFFAENCAYNGYDVTKISKPGNGFVGYELIPDYPTALCEDGNVLQVGYGEGGDGEIKVYTWLLLKRDNGGLSFNNEIVRGR